MGKLVSVISGMIYDVAVDIRPGSATYGKWHGVILDGKTNTNFWIPDGFLHGFYVSFLFQEAYFFNQIFSISKLNVDEKFNQLFDHEIFTYITDYLQFSSASAYGRLYCNAC